MKELLDTAARYMCFQKNLIIENMVQLWWSYGLRLSRIQIMETQFNGETNIKLKYLKRAQRNHHMNMRFKEIYQTVRIQRSNNVV
jgi:hypothetical protein